MDVEGSELLIFKNIWPERRCQRISGAVECSGVSEPYFYRMASTLAKAREEPWPSGLPVF